MVHESLYVVAAVCPQLGHLTALILPYANSQMRTLFLAEVAAELPDYFIVMLVDQAGWHLSGQVAIPENIRLLPQLAGSPELNPTEHLWEGLRENEMVNRHFNELEPLEQALCTGISRLASNPEKLKNLTTTPCFLAALARIASAVTSRALEACATARCRAPRVRKGVLRLSSQSRACL